MDSNLCILYVALGFNSPEPLIKTSLELIREIISQERPLINASSPDLKSWLSVRFNLYVKLESSISSMDSTLYVIEILVNKFLVTSLLEIEPKPLGSITLPSSL